MVVSLAAGEVIPKHLDWVNFESMSMEVETENVD